MTVSFTEGALVRARNREWVVVDATDPTFLVVRPLAGADEDLAAVIPDLEPVEPATFPPPTADDLGDAASARLLRDALRLGFRSSAGPFRSLARLAVTPRNYQYVPLMMALRQSDRPAVRLLIADGVGLGKTIEAGLVAAELLAQGDARRLAVLCSPALAPQWREELAGKFGLSPTVVLPSTVNRLSRGLAMGESLFDRHPHVVVSTDLIKQKIYRDDFARACPELVIVDEAHTSVTSGGTSRKSASLRHDLLTRLARDERRHLLLLTATPHQGDAEGWRELLALLDPALGSLPADLSGPDRDADRALLSRFFVQRQRADIREYLHEQTAFPERETTEARYTLHDDYRALIDKAIGFARETVAEPGLAALHQRVRWWSMVALLRSLASSPAAAADTLRKRAAAATAETPEEADEIGRSLILDTDDDATSVDADDVTPGAAPDETRDPRAETTRRRLFDFARQADTLRGAKDHKTTQLTTIIKKLLAGGFQPIVFCRYVPTAEYVGEHLRRTLGDEVRLEVVTGQQPPEAREAAVKELGVHDGNRVLVATDCLAEGVNLQEWFTAVVHYDLAWNPTRHEQREGRVDRFGQPAPTVRAITYYGANNPVDGIVLDVLVRKHDAIRKATGVSVAVPVDSTAVMQAVYEGLILRGRDPEQGELFELPGMTGQAELFAEWERLAERERKSRSRFAQHIISPVEVGRELAAIRDALGGHSDAESVVRTALSRLGSVISDFSDDKGFTATLAPLPRGLRDLLPANPAATDISFRRDLPVPPGAQVLTRTDPAVEEIAAYCLDAALDPQLAASFRPARRAGVMRTTAVTQATALLVCRIRFHLTLPGRTETVPLVVEEAHLAAFTGPTQQPAWVEPDDLSGLLAATPAGNVPEGVGRLQISRLIDGLPDLASGLDDQAERKAVGLADAHRRVREAAHTPIRGLQVTAQRPVDILGTYLFLPAGPA